MLTYTRCDPGLTSSCTQSNETGDSFGASATERWRWQKCESCSACRACAHKVVRPRQAGRKGQRDSYSLYLLFFFRAWQEDGYFFCQTELCCRDTCREMMDCFGSQWPVAQAKYPSLMRHFPRSPPGNHVESVGELVPENTVWKICHDVAAGLSHIHSHGIVHNDIKPSNIFLVPHSRLGALLKIGDFGMAGDVGTSEDGQEGDTLYMAPELLSSAARHPSADIFSLGLTLSTS